jgi:hypothetical protein
VEPGVSEVAIVVVPDSLGREPEGLCGGICLNVNFWVLVGFFLSCSDVGSFGIWVAGVSGLAKRSILLVVHLSLTVAVVLMGAEGRSEVSGDETSATGWFIEEAMLVPTTLFAEVMGWLLGFCSGGVLLVFLSVAWWLFVGWSGTGFRTMNENCFPSSVNLLSTVCFAMEYIVCSLTMVARISFLKR